VTFTTNIVAGYWRAHAKTRRNRLEWFLAVHLPIPLVALLRRMAGVGFTPQSLPFLLSFIAAYFLGQRIGGVLHSRFLESLGETRRFIILDWLRLRSTQLMGYGR